MRPPSLFVLYVALYCFGRFWIEQLRVDPAHELRRPPDQRARLRGGLCDRDGRVRLAPAPRSPHAGGRGRRRAEAERGDGRAAQPRPVARLALRRMTAVRELELDLDAFAGPFDLLLTLLLREELEPADIDMAAIVVAFVERLAERRSSTSRPAASSSS